MDTQQITAPSRATAGDRRPATPSGVIHVNTRHTSRYTVIGNHLAQHREMSLAAIGLAVHIQSRPAGAKIGIKFLADRFPESETRIAAALRELESHGYLSRSRERTSGGRVVTRTVSYNQPGAGAAARTGPARSAPKPEPRAGRQQQQREPVVPAPTASTPAPVVVPEQRAASPGAAPPSPLPEQQTHDLAHHRAAIDLLAGLRRHDPRLLLSEDDIRRLAPALAAWLERDAHPDAVRRTLVADLPEPLRHPAGLLARRLAVLLPPPLPAAPAREALRRPDPLQNCDGCDRAFRAPEPGECCDCRETSESGLHDHLERCA
ncbi:helix-turn-helix domain-containing protein [Streptomyces sp. NBC_01800]|uniref:helix-turn-helix domain-containing protein n=1 Tax=Streptomyces sp. NBC_01800 TaxID=2975945 RepID=UPI002DD94636|nr:helix-turn-helix domain-containing protein [Streptomyces sp. NBC_01800]WSA68316.1 helix-turn-helix domain-containing protein [Streptomyces sp. NBC_01800]